MEKLWKINDTADQALVRQLESQLNVDPLVSRLLVQRNVRTFEEARLFFRPELSHLHDPFLMHGMATAIERIEKAISSDEKVLIYGDYDVDGTTAVSILYSFFKEHIRQVRYYIPDRYKEGYGISVAGIDYAAAEGYGLVIALDCGIKAVEKVSYAKTKGVDFIICDHHLPGEILPDAVAILDPKQPACTYPYKELSGAGIGFKLIQAYCAKHEIPAEKCFAYLDLVAASIAADIVPIDGENRVLAHFGLVKINQSPRPGIKALLNLGQMKGPVTISTLVFTLGPRINAAGRIEHGSKAVELLTCEDEELAGTFAHAIDDTNSQRRDLDLGTTVEAIEILRNDEGDGGRYTTVLFSEKWHKGVIGIVASRLIEKYYRPTIVLTESEGMVTGSARSVREYDVYAAIEKCSDLLEQFGGHKFAAGLSLRKENIVAFRERFESVVAGSISPEQMKPRLEIDAEVEFREINDKLLRILRQFAPHGPANMAPLFCSRNVFDTGWGQVIGSNHLKLELFQKHSPHARFQAIAFDKGDFISFFQRKTPMDIVYKVQESEYRGVTTIQLVVEDLKISES